MYGPIRRTVSTTAGPASSPQRRNRLHRHKRSPHNRQIPRRTCRFEKSRIFASLIAKQGLTKLKRQNESLRNHRKTAVTGNNVSHSVRRTKRRFNPNLKTKRFWLEEEGRWITLKVSAAGIKTINKKGLTAALKEAKAPKNLY